MIEGVIVQPLKKISDDRGKVFHMLRADSKFFRKFGEIYFSLVNPGVVKAWKKHKLMTQHFTVPIGKIQLVLYDDRKKSRTKGEVQKINMGEKNYKLVIIPRKVWYGFKGVSKKPSLIVNCTDIPHKPGETIKADIKGNKIPFSWK